MRKITIPAALLIAAFCLSAGEGVVHAQAATSARANEDALPQIELTESLIQQFIAARAEIDTVLGDEAPEPGEPADAKFAGRLEAIAKKHKFADYDEYDTIAGNIELVLDGVDPATKTYFGEAVLIQRQIDAAQANASLPAEDKKATIAELKDSLRDVAPLKFPGNAALVLKHYDELSETDSPGSK